MEEIEKKLREYKDTHDGKDFMCDVSTKTIEEICQLLRNSSAFGFLLRVTPTFKVAFSEVGVALAFIYSFFHDQSAG